jgi:DNA-binding IclR family transcriptional regulator
MFYEAPKKEVAMETKGSQAVHRSTVLLKLVALHHLTGVDLHALCKSAGLQRTTAYRILSSLVQTGLVERDANKRYRLGVEAMQLGLNAMIRAPILERCRPFMMRIARRTEDAVFVIVRNGDYAHCLHCEEGKFSVRARVSQVGGMRLIGEGSAGIALLATLTDAQVAALYKHHSGDGAVMPYHVQKLVSQTRRQGYAITENIVADGISGVGMSFEVANGAYAAMSVAATNSRMPADRQLWIAELLGEELRSAGWNPVDPQS